MDGVLMQHTFSGPLYEQVHQLLSKRIRSGEWPNGKPIPGEADLSREYGVSIGTVRKAMDKLTSERIVVRERGRGTFISPPTSQKPLAIGQLLDERGEPAPLAISLIGAAVQPANAEAQLLLFGRLFPEPPHVNILQRVWKTDGRVVCRETLTVSDSRFPDFTARLPDPTETYFDHYAEKFGVAIHGVAWALKSTGSKARSNGALRPIREGSSSDLIVRRTAFDASATVVEICELALTLGSETFQVALPASTQV